MRSRFRFRFRFRSLTSVFLRRRQVWLPTLWGCALLVIVAVLAAVVLARMANGWLAPNLPAAGLNGRGARTLVIEGWMETTDLDQAVLAFRRGHYERVVTTGGPLDSWPEVHAWKNFAELAASYLRRNDLDNVALVAVPAPASAQDRTFLSAVMVRDWARRSGTVLGSVDVFSSGVHARRSRLLYRMALGPDVEVGVLAARPQMFDAERWWTTSVGVKSVIGETLSLGWTVCCFWPPATGSSEERWGLPRPVPRAP